MARVIVLSMPANPAAGGAATLFDSTATGPTATTLGQRNWWRRRGASRLRITVYPSDQAVTLTVDSIVAGSSTWRNVLTKAIGAGTYDSTDQAWIGDDMRVVVTNGVPAPTDAEYSCNLVMGDQAPSA